MLRHVLWTLTSFLLISSPLVATEKPGDREKNKSAKPKITPSERIEQLLHILKTDRKDEHRSNAAEELGKLASPEYPEVVSGLIDALVRDESSSVRKVVVRTLSGIQPATHEVKEALDQAVKQDKAWTVRQAARLAVWRYKPTDEPPSTPGPKLRNTSKPTQAGNVPALKKITRPPAEQMDPLKSLPIPTPPVPAVPAVEAPPAPVMAPGPGLPVPQTASGRPAQLTAPKPSGN